VADLRVNYAGVEFKNPLVLASATPGWDGEGMRLAAEAGIGGVVPKTIGPQQDWAAHPCNGRLHLVRHGGKPIGMVNLELFTTKSREAWIEHDLTIAKKGGAVMQISILAMPNPEETAELVEQIQNTGMADLLELNVSCPMPASTVGMHIGKSAELTYKQAKAAKSAAKIPLTVKLTPNVADMVEIAQAVKEAGGDGVTISNSIRSFAGVDIETGLPLLRGYGGYTGPAIKPIIMRHLSEVARSVDIPISAIGGVMSYKEIVEYIMLGATTVQTCTAVMWNGYSIIPRLLKDLENWMDKKGYKSLDEIRGIALPHITTVEELAKMPAKYAGIDPETCTNCGKCEKVCFYRAISPGEESYVVDKSKCDGCGLCAQWCPIDSIILSPLS
jgi:dihydropyrimidine dehydrogenase (NAD+) subunit PreA